MQQQLGRKEGREMEGQGEGMKSMITQQQVSLRDLHHHHHHHHHGQNGHFHESQNSGPHPQDDDFMEQMLSTINPTDCSNAWPPPPPHSHSSNPLLPTLPLTLATADSLLSHSSDVVHPSSKGQGGEDGSVPPLFSGFAGSLHGNAPPPHHHHQQQHFHHPSQDQGGIGKKYGGQTTAMMNTDQAPGAPPTSASTGGSTGTATQRQRIRARRGQATDPHSIAERLRRERIAERMKALQELVPNANKTDKASMLDEIIDYVKFLQLQVKVLSMSRLGGAAGVAPLGADMSSEGGLGRKSNSNGNGSANESMTMTEHQVAKLMEEDMGSAMQYLQGKGLCLMPISLATAISTTTARSPLTSPPTRLPHINTNADFNNANANTNPQLNLVRVGVQSNMNVNMSSSASADHLPSVKDNNNPSSSTKP